MLGFAVNYERLKESAGSLGASIGFILQGALILFLLSTPQVEYSSGWSVTGYGMISIGVLGLMCVGAYSINRYGKPVIAEQES